MKTQNYMLSFVALGLVLMMLVACGGSSNVAADELPVYPGALVLEDGEGLVGNATGAEQNAAIQQAVGNLGSSGMERRAFRLPENSTWEAVNSFYENELSNSGWTNGLGGVAGNLVDVNALMGAANQENDLFQTAIWSKNNQTLNILTLTDPTDPTNTELLLSLTTP